MNYREILEISEEEMEVSFSLTGRYIYAGVFLLRNNKVGDFVSINSTQLLSPTRFSFYSVKHFDVSVKKICKVYDKVCYSGFLGFFLFSFDYILMISIRLKLKYFILLGMI